MVHTITCALKSDDPLLVQQFKDRLAAATIKATDLSSTNSKYTYLNLQWDDSIPAGSKHSTHRAGAKPKKLLYDGKVVTCGLVWQLREEGHLADAAIGLILDVSESTITRKRKKHLTDGDFRKGSTVIF